MEKRPMERSVLRMKKLQDLYSYLGEAYVLSSIANGNACVLLAGLFLTIKV